MTSPYGFQLPNSELNKPKPKSKTKPEENFAHKNSFFSAAGIPEQKEEKTSKRS
jgi:hypothetical protein